MKEVVESYFKQRSLVNHQLASYNDCIPTGDGRESRMEKIVRSIRIGSDEQVEDERALRIYEENIHPDFTRNFCDEVYMDGEIKRTDYSCDRAEALTEINRLVAAFPEYTVEQLTAEAQNVIGQYGAYRPPYNDNSISFYD